MAKKPKMSSNGILMECHNIEQLPRKRLKVEPVTLSRNAVGRWSLNFDVEFSFTLDDGREIRGERRITVGSIIQRGRKPRVAQ